MWSIASLLAVADAYKEALGVPDTTVSRRCMDDSSRLADLRAGSDIGTRRLRRVLLWFSENWPKNAVWPALVERPARRPDDNEPSPPRRVRGEVDEHAAV